jgi:hypothetical protein
MDRGPRSVQGYLIGPTNDRTCIRGTSILRRAADAFDKGLRHEQANFNPRRTLWIASAVAGSFQTRSAKLRVAQRQAARSFRHDKQSNPEIGIAKAIR